MTIQEMIDATPPGGTLRLNGEVFQTEETVVGKPGITIDWQGAKILSNDPLTDKTGNARRNRSHFKVASGSKNINGPHIIGPAGHKPKYDARSEAQHGINCSGATDFLVSEATVSSVFGDGMYFGEGPIGKGEGLQPGRGIVCARGLVQDFVSQDSGRMGVAITSAEDITINGLSIARSARSAIDIEPAHGPRKPEDKPWGFRSVRRIAISNFGISEYGNNFVAGTGIGDVSDISFSGGRVDEWRLWLGERPNPAYPAEESLARVPMRGPWLFKDIIAESGSDGGQQSEGLQQAQMLMFSCENVTLWGIEVGPIRQDRRKAWMARGNERTTGLVAIDCTPSANGSGLFHPQSTSGAEILVRSSSASGIDFLKLPATPKPPQ